MHEARARSALAQVEGATNGRAVLWREFDPSEDDVDLTVAPGAESALRRALGDAGLAPDPRHEGRVFWEGNGVRIDVREAAAWPAYYPPLEGVVARASAQGGLPPLASPEDRLLIMAADAVYGRELDRIVTRSRALLDEPGVRARAEGLARAEGFQRLVPLVTDPDRLEAYGRRGRLPYPRAAGLALRSRPAFKAFAARLGKLAQLGAGRALRRRLGPRR
jgi:hypothetical protein